MLRAIRKALAVLALVCCLGGSVTQGQRMPWEVSNPDAEKAYFDILSVMNHGQYAKSEKMWRDAASSFSRNPSEHLLFVLGLGNLYRLQARFEQSFECYRYCQTHHAQALRDNVEAHATLMEGYADLACEFSETGIREKAILACKAAFSLLPPSSGRRVALARKLATLFRLIKKLPHARDWLETALREPRQFCEDSARIGIENACLSAKEGNLATAAILFDEAKAHLQSCPYVYQEDWITYYFYLGDFHQAISQANPDNLESLKAARTAFEKAAAIGDSHQEVMPNLLYMSYSRLATMKADEGDITGAIADAEKAAVGQRRRGISRKGISLAYDELAFHLHYIGRFEEALNYYNQALLMYPKAQTGKDEKAMYITRLANYAQELINNGRFEEGKARMEDAIREQHLVDTTNFSKLANFFQNIGVGYHLNHRHKESIPSLVEAVRLHSKAPSKSWFDRCYTRAHLAIGLGALGLAQEAQRQIDTCLSEFGQIATTNPMDRAMVLEMITEYHLQQRDFEAALQSNDRFMRTMIRSLGMGNLLDCPDLDKSVSPWHTLTAASQKSIILSGLYKESQDLTYLRASLECSQKALARMRKLRQEFSTEEAKLKVNARWKRLFENAMWAVMELYRRTQDPHYQHMAFEIAEQSKAMLLMEAVLDNRVLENNPANAALVTKRQNTQARITRLRDEIKAGKTSGNKLAKLYEELFAMQARLDSIMVEIKATNPKYSQLVNAFDVVTIAELQPLLKRDGRALVEYFYSDSAIYTFLVTPTAFAVHTYEPTVTFIQSLDSFTRSLHASPMDAEEEARQYLAHSQVILEAVWEPIADLLPRRVTVIPDGPLSFVSFEALADSMAQPEKPKFRNMRFLLEDATISYDYSATFLAKQSPGMSPASSRVLAIAPSFREDSGLDPLPGSVEGLRRLAANYSNVTALLEGAGTKRALLEQGATYDVVDLATHGRYDRENFLNSCIHFSHDGSGDSMLTLSELYTSNLPTRLAILEACETGVGDYHQGEGVMSMARAFTYAGCKSVLMSLWEVAEDTSTRDIMEYFYANLADSLPRDEAIAQAKRLFLEKVRSKGGYFARKAHPFFWSELVLIGENTPLPIARAHADHRLLWGIAGLSALVLLIAGLWRWRRKRGRAATLPKGQASRLSRTSSGMATSRTP